MKRECSRPPALDTSELRPAQTATGLPGLPTVGQEITTELLGRCTVTHLLRFPDGEEVPVAASPKGASMIRAGDWQPWVPTPPTHLPAPEQSHDAPPIEEAAPVSPAPNPNTMPDLFSNWS